MSHYSSRVNSPTRGSEFNSWVTQSHHMMPEGEEVAIMVTVLNAGPSDPRLEFLKRAAVYCGQEGNANTTSRLTAMDYTVIEGHGHTFVAYDNRIFQSGSLVGTEMHHTTGGEGTGSWVIDWTAARLVFRHCQWTLTIASLHWHNEYAKEQGRKNNKRNFGRAKAIHSFARMKQLEVDLVGLDGNQAVSTRERHPERQLALEALDMVWTPSFKGSLITWPGQYNEDYDCVLEEPLSDLTRPWTPLAFIVPSESSISRKSLRYIWMQEARSAQTGLAPSDTNFHWPISLRVFLSTTWSAKPTTLRSILSMPRFPPLPTANDLHGIYRMIIPSNVPLAVAKAQVTTNRRLCAPPPQPLPTRRRPSSSTHIDHEEPDTAGAYVQPDSLETHSPTAISIVDTPTMTPPPHVLQGSTSSLHVTSSSTLSLPQLPFCPPCLASLTMLLDRPGTGLTQQLPLMCPPCTAKFLALQGRLTAPSP